jgi:hypothetical protein
MLADVLLMVTNVYPMVAKESKVANPKKLEKLMNKWQHCFRLRQPMNYPIPAKISHISYHRFYQLQLANHQ